MALTYQAAHPRVLFLERDVLGGAAARLELPHHQAELGPAQKRVHVGERRRRHRRRVALVGLQIHVQRAQTTTPSNLQIIFQKSLQSNHSGQFHHREIEMLSNQYQSCAV